MLDAEIINELAQCKTELEEAANLLRPKLPGMAGIYDAAANRVAALLARHSAEAKD